MIDTENPALTDFAKSLSAIFMIESPRKEREGFGRCINVNDRILNGLGSDQKFSFRIVDKNEANPVPDQFGLEMSSTGRNIINSVKRYY